MVISNKPKKPVKKKLNDKKVDAIVEELFENVKKGYQASQNSVNILSNDNYDGLKVDESLFSYENINRLCSGLPYPLSDEQYEIAKKIIKWIREECSMTLQYGKSAPFKRLSGFAGCIDSSSLLVTDRGLMTLEDIIKLQRKDLNFTGFESFKESVNVLSHDNTWNPITDIYATEDNTDGYIITTKTGNVLKCSWKHPLYQLNTNGEYVWTKAIDLKVGEKVAIKSNYDLGDSIDNDDELFEILGYIYADAAIIYNEEAYSYRIIFTSKDKEFLEYSNKQFVSLFNFNSKKVVVKSDKNNFALYYNFKSNTKFMNFLNSYIDLNNHKVIQRNTFKNVSLSNIKSFLNGIFTDLCITKKEITFSNKFYENVIIVKNLLYILNIKTGNINFHKNKYNCEYRMSILSTSIQTFIDIFKDKKGKKSGNRISDILNGKIQNTHLDSLPEINSLLTEAGGFNTFDTMYYRYMTNKSYISYNKLKLGYNHPRIKMIVDDNHFWDEIISIEPIKQKFYDITVKDKESFISNSFISHNSGKSALISWLITEGFNSFPESIKMKSIAVCSFTWKAALVLQSRGIKDACSIHSIFYEIQGADDGKPYFSKRTREEVHSAYSLIIIDEASMVGKFMREDIEYFGVPVLYVGDAGQ